MSVDAEACWAPECGCGAYCDWPAPLVDEEAAVPDAPVEDEEEGLIDDSITYACPCASYTT